MPLQAQSYAEQTQKVMELQQREADLRRQQDRELKGHIEKVTEARAEISKALKTYHDTVGLALKAVQRSTSEDAAQIRVGLTLQGRMVGVIHQALARAESMDRRVTAIQEARQERDRQEERQKAAQALKTIKQDVQRTLLPQSDDYELLYGEEDEVTYAS